MTASSCQAANHRRYQKLARHRHRPQRLWSCFRPRSYSILQALLRGRFTKRFGSEFLMRLSNLGRLAWKSRSSMLVGHTVAYSSKFLPTGQFFQVLDGNTFSMVEVADAATASGMASQPPIDAGNSIILYGKRCLVRLFIAFLFIGLTSNMHSRWCREEAKGYPFGVSAKQESLTNA